MYSVRTPKIAWPTVLGVVATVGVFSFVLDRRYDTSQAAVHDSLEMRAAIDETLSLLKDAETDESASVLEITRGATAKMEELAETIDLRRRAELGEALMMVREGRGRRLMVAMRAETARMLAREETRLREREQAASVGRRRLTIIVGGIWTLFFVSVIAALGVAIRGGRHIRRLYEQLN